MATFKGILQEKVDAALRIFDDFARCGGVCHDMAGTGRPSMGKALCRLCSACVAHHSAGDFCRHAAVSGAYHSFSIGEIYLSRCWLGLHFLVAPIAPDGKEVVGAFEAGGILFSGELQRAQHDMMSKLSAMDSSERLASNISSLQGLEEASLLDVENLKSFMRETMFSCGLLDSSAFDSKRISWKRQQLLSDVSGMSPGITVGDARRRVLELSASLMEFIEVGDASGVEDVSSRILGNAMLASGMAAKGDASGMRPFLLPAISCAAMSKSGGGKSWSARAVLLSKWMEEMGGIENPDELCSWFSALCSEAISNGGKGFGDVRGSFSDRLVAYLNDHFSESLKIEAVARHLGVSSSSLMHKVKEETGSTFSKLLNEARVREAKRLLAFTSLPVGEVAFRCGFKDQSYFTKVFYSVVNIKPRDFRKMLSGMTP